MITFLKENDTSQNLGQSVFQNSFSRSFSLFILPSFTYSSETLDNLLPFKHDVNQVIRDMSTLGSHFSKILAPRWIIILSKTCNYKMPSLSYLHVFVNTKCMASRSSLDTFRYAFINFGLRLITTSHIKNLIFICLIYYEIRGGYYYLYQDLGGSLSTFFHYPKKCLALLMNNTFNHRSKPFRGPPQPKPIRRIKFFLVACPLREKNSILRPITLQNFKFLRCGASS